MFKRLVKAHVDKFQEKRKVKSSKVMNEMTKKSYTSLRIFLHSTITIMEADFLLMEGSHPEFIGPTGSMSVLAIGQMPFDKMTFTRVYLSDEAGEEFILNILEQDRVLQEMVLLREIATFHPRTEAEWGRHLSQIGFMTFVVDEFEYNRVWGDQWTEKEEFEDNEFEETFVEKDKVSVYTNQYLVYERVIKSSEAEILFVGIEEDEDDQNLVFQLGYVINPSDIEIL